jgi:WD40 repeat protein
LPALYRTRVLNHPITSPASSAKKKPGRVDARLRGHQDYVSSAAFSPDGKRIVTASADKTARLWEIFPNAQAYVMHGHEAAPSERFS